MTIEYVEFENLLHDQSEVLVCPTNAVGAMGAGLAKLFRGSVRGLFLAYRQHCVNHNPNDLVPFVFKWAERKQIVYCLHTKRLWKENSTTKIVQRGLAGLLAWCEKHDIKSISMPALGCGHGGLLFEEEVLPLLKECFEHSDIVVRLHMPDF